MRWLNPRHRQEAVTITTFALIAPVLMLVIFGTLEMGRVLQAWMVITNEAREAARYAAVTFDASKDWTLASNQSDKQTAVQAYISNRLRGVLDQTYLTPAPAVVVTNDSPPRVQVTIYYKVPLIVPLVNQMLPGLPACPGSADPCFPVAARSAMRGE
jgi:Flp pilus assembly protein TadG